MLKEVKRVLLAGSIGPDTRVALQWPTGPQRSEPVTRRLRRELSDGALMCVGRSIPTDVPSTMRVTTLGTVSHAHERAGTAGLPELQALRLRLATNAGASSSRHNPARC